MLFSTPSNLCRTPPNASPTTLKNHFSKWTATHLIVHDVDPVRLGHAALRALGCVLRRRTVYHARGHDHDELGDPLLHALSVAGSLRLPLDW